MEPLLLSTISISPYVTYRYHRDDMNRLGNFFIQVDREYPINILQMLLHASFYHVVSGEMNTWTVIPTNFVTLKYTFVTTVTPLNSARTKENVEFYELVLEIEQS